MTRRRAIGCAAALLVALGGTAGRAAVPVVAASANATEEKPLRLRDLQALAQRADPRAQMAVAQLEKALGQQNEAAWVWFPKFETTLGGGGPVGEARLKAGPDGALNDVSDGTRQGLWHGGEWGATLRGNMDAILPLYTFGKISSGQAAAAAGVRAREHLLTRELRGVDLDMAKAYWGYQTTRDAQKSIETVSKQVAEAKATAQRLLAEESDQISLQDVTRLEYIEQEIHASNATALKSQHTAEVALKLLVGRMPEESLTVARETLPQAPEVPAREAMLERARQSRPDLRAALENVSARQSLVELEKAKLWPDLGLMGGASFAWTSNADSPNTPFANNPYNSLSFYVGLGLRGTFDVPQKLARIQQAEADLHEAQALLVGAQRLARLEIEAALDDLVDAKARAERYTQAAVITKKLMVQSAVAFDSGLGQAFDLFVNLLLFQRGEGERIRALYEGQVGWAVLEKAVGGQIEAVPVAPAAMPGKATSHERRDYEEAP